MAPIRNSNQQILTGIHTVATRSRTIANSSNHSKDVLRGKRKADGSPSKEKVAKRSAFGDVSNVLEMAKHMENGKATVKTVAKKVTVSTPEKHIQ